MLAIAATRFENLTRGELVEQAIKRNEGFLAANQALTVTTGKRTGRSPKDRFIVRDSITENTVDWGGINQPISQEAFNRLWEKTENYLYDRDHFVSSLRVGADTQYSIPLTVTTETAWHALFANNMFIQDHSHVPGKEAWTLLHAPGMTTDPTEDGVNSDGAVIINFGQRRALFCGMQYAGEMKKAMFTVLNFILPDLDVLPMHCGSNMGKQGDTALFFGLSGTGKTTLSTDPERLLIGDDEHGWGPSGVFNFEGGCYAKCIDLSAEREPVIYQAIRFGSIMENVYCDPKTKAPDYGDDRYTQNSRASYPLEFVEQRVLENRGGHPQALVFLTCDLYGVLPPVAILSKEQAAYHFLSGYTARVGSTEIGSSAAIAPTFSTCFGAPFFPRPPHVYAELLMKKIVEHGSHVYLVNTGWTGGGYGEGKRFSIPTTRAIVHAILNGEVKQADTEILPGFNLRIPNELAGIDSKLLDPRKAWNNHQAYDEKLRELIQQFVDNFKRFNVSDSVRKAGPQ